MRKVVGWRNPAAMYPMRCVCLALGMMAVLFSSPVFGQALPGYEIRDTTAFDNNGLEGPFWRYVGNYGLLYYRGAFVDTVDVTFGLLPFDGGAIYRPLATEPSRRFSVSGIDSTPQAVVWKPEAYIKEGQRIPLSEMLPQYSWAESAIAVDGSVLYYWGVRPDTAQWWKRVSAMRFDATTAQVDSSFLYLEFFEVDSGGFYRPVKFVGDLLCFYETYGFRLFLLDTAMTIVRRFGIPPGEAGRDGDWENRQTRSCDELNR